MFTADERRAAAHLIDQGARKKLGLPSSAVRVRRYGAGSRTRRWTDTEIRAAVLEVAGGRPISASQYKVLRAPLDPNKYPSHKTAARRCPELFT